jgi:hypothetical protein
VVIGFRREVDIMEVLRILKAEEQAEVAMPILFPCLVEVSLEDEALEHAPVQERDRVWGAMARPIEALAGEL